MQGSMGCGTRQIILLIAAAIIIGTFAQAATQVSQYGITWYFDKDCQVGQFANGDYWVVGPVTIRDISPRSQDIGGRTMNGSMINPIPGTTSFRQGYDSAPKDAAGSYLASLNVALNVGISKSLYVPNNSSLISSISLPTADSWPQLQTAAILTVLPSAPPAGSFRPPYCGTDKSVKFNKASLDYDILLDLPLVSGTPVLSTIEGYFARPWLDQYYSYQMTRLMPRDNMPCYGREICSTIGEGAVALNLDWGSQSKETLYVRMVQLGIDLYGSYKAGMTWMPDGGIYAGRKLPILLAGYALASDPDAQGMKNIGSNLSNDPYFQEDADTFYVSQADLVRYPSSMLGVPEWGIRHATDPTKDSNIWDCSYRRCCNANSWAGIVLTAHIMGLKGAWNHNALFDYQDRYMGIETPNTFNRQQIRWVEVAWDAYRAQAGPIWPNTSQNNPPTANAGQDKIVTAVNGTAQVTLDGSLSFDSDGTIQSFVWSENGTQIAAGQTATVT
ncbi:MAG: hypothetical protein PHF37_01985, partial [Phycisphaerae bacterium]|nr:hypothetical protein [Phycisphaerae bacterium]